MASGNQDFGVLETFRSYFPTCGSELITLPCLDRCLSNTLFSTNEKGERERNESHLGELCKFPKEVLSKLDKPAGILMSRYEAEHVKNILHLSDQFNLQFELDWLLCGNLFIVPFEVSVATKVENVATVLDNKLRQVIEKIVPKMKLILFTIFKHRFSAENSQNDDSNLGIMFEEFLRNRFRAVIYIPDCCSEDIQEALHSKVSKSKNRKRNQCLQDIMEKAEKCGTLNLIEILTHEKSDVSQLHLYSLDSNLNLHKSELAMEQIFSPDSRTAMSSENEEAAIFNYMSAILCLSFLMIGNPLMSDPLDIDTRYQFL
ncbi:uncharacterized protein LOC142351647 [Convolutriloba macropyga]|uniref:uncharacterized protein LOC142351647 n=1 Tax=Convolutriloba macropyga TaxID=536237 RepID=UPI003F521AC3